MDVESKKLLALEITDERTDGAYDTKEVFEFLKRKG